MGIKISAVAIQALKDALCSIYWYKSDLRGFLNNSIEDKSIITKADWSNYKRQIVSDIVDNLCEDQEKYLGDIRRLFYEVKNMNSFRHLEHLEDGKRKAQRARDAVNALKNIVDKHDQKIKEEKEIAEKRTGA